VFSITYYNTQKVTVGNYTIWFNGSSSCIENLKFVNTIHQTILNGYESLQLTLIQKLEYNFAIIIEDIKKETIVVARDRFGIEPLYYIKEGNTYHFSQNIKDLVKLNCTIDHLKIYNYLNHYNSKNTNIYDTSTFYAQIKSVLPAHLTVITSDKVTITPYWTPGTVDFKPREIYDRFAELLMKSLTSNTAPYQNISAQVSGGIDSSSLAILYSKMGKSTTMNIDPDIAGSRDGFYLKKVIDHIKTEHYTLPPEKDIYGCVSTFSQHSGVPDHVILSSAFMVPISKKAAELNSDAILCGHDGDTVIGHGDEYLTDLKNKGDWYTFSTMLTQIALDTESSHLYTNWNTIEISKRVEIIKENQFGGEIINLLKSGEIKQIKKLLADTHREFGYTSLSFIIFLAKKVFKKIINPRINSNLNLAYSPNNLTIDESLDQLYSFNHYTASNQFKNATSQRFIEINEQLFTTGQYYGHKYLFPFMERRLLEFSMNVPDEIKFGKGKTRALLKNGFRDVIPPELLNRGGKTDFIEYSLRSCIQLWKYNHDKFLENTKVWDYVDKKNFIKQINLVGNPNINIGSKSNIIRNLNRVMYLGIWLDTLK
jgi:asparagine synthase (glutamine-hydrolysing)